MEECTNFFVITELLKKNDVTIPEVNVEDMPDTLTDEELLKSLIELFSEMKTLEDYKTLIDILHEIEDSISLHFLYILFQALIPLEKRIWESANMYPPVEEIIMNNLNTLFEDAEQCCVDIESAFIDWTKKTGAFDDDTSYEFIRSRNAIFADYISFVCNVINVST